MAQQIYINALRLMNTKEPEGLVHNDFATGPSHGLVMEFEGCGGRS